MPVLERPEQAKFRNELQLLYGECVISGCQVMPALDAAHIAPVAKKGEFHPTNGVLLRADLHRLFDANLIGIKPDDLTVHFAKSVLPAKSVPVGESVPAGEYGLWDRQSIKIPTYLSENEKPLTENLVWRWRLFSP